MRGIASSTAAPAFTAGLAACGGGDDAGSTSEVALAGLWPLGISPKLRRSYLGL